MFNCNNIISVEFILDTCFIRVIFGVVTVKVTKKAIQYE